MRRSPGKCTPDGTGSPITFGRSIDSGRGGGFTGWIVGVAVFNRALSAGEMGKLAAMAKGAPIPTPTRASH